MKKSLTIILLISVFLGGSVLAQESDDRQSKSYDIGTYTKIFIEGGFRVYLIQDEECDFTAKSSDEEIFDDLIVRNENGKLHVKLDREIFQYQKVTLYFTFRQLEQLEIEGGANLNTRGYVDLDDFSMRVEGGAKIEMELKAENIEIVGEGGFLFELEGVTKTFEVKISGAGHVDAENLKAQQVDFRVEGFGTGSVYAEKELNARIEGVGKVRYKGNPKVIQYIDGLGSVKQD